MTPDVRWLLGIITLVACGCGGKYDLAPVSGVVTIDGKPYPGGKVIFYPVRTGDSEIAGRPSFGIPDSEGRFELSCLEPNDGAIVGQHSITLFRSPDHDTTRPDLKSLDFKRVNLSTGKVTVTSGENQVDVAFTSDEIRKNGNRL